MADYEQILYDIEVHSLQGISRYFDQGGSPNEIHNGVPLFTTMVEMYMRSPRFKQCVQAFIEHGLVYQEKALLAVLADDAELLEALIKADPGLAWKTYDLYNNTYTPLTGGTLLHFCAEYNSVRCAKILLRSQADVNARAATDGYGFGGHTPIFHTVNQNGNHSAAMMHLLAEHGADLGYTIKGLIWGKGYPWETFIPSVNPISYAMMGLLPQMHRPETAIAETVSILIRYAWGIEYAPGNVPCAYLKQS